MNKLKKLWHKAAAAGAAASLLLTGCASSQKVITVDPELVGTAEDPLLNYDDTINLTVFSQTANWSGKQTGWGATLLKDMFNIELTIIPDSDGTYETRMERGDLGDIVVWGSNGSEYQQAVELGRLFDWEEDDLLENYGDNILNYFSAAVEANRELNEDGKVYGIGNKMASDSDEHDLYLYNWGIRWDLYEELGYPEVNTLDDLADVLKQMQELEPTGDDGKKVYAASLWPDWDGAMAMNAKSLATCYYGYDELGLGLYDPATGDFYDALAEDGPYEEALRFYNKLYREGLLDPDSMTQTYDTMLAKVKNGDVLFSVFDYAGSTAYNTEAHMSENKIMRPLAPSQAHTMVYGLSDTGGERIWSIGANSVYPEKCMQLINWLCSTEGGLTTWYGIKGLMWDYDEDGNTYLTELGKACYDDSSYDLSGVEWTSPYTGETYTLSGTFNDGLIQINNETWAPGAINPDSASGECFSALTWASEQGDPKNDADASWREYTGAVTDQEYLNTTDYSVMPSINYSETTRDQELDLKWQQVITQIKQSSWNAIYAKSDEEFESILSEARRICGSYGYDECVKWCQEEAARKFALQQELE